MKYRRDASRIGKERFKTRDNFRLQGDFENPDDRRVWAYGYNAVVDILGREEAASVRNAMVAAAAAVLRERLQVVRERPEFQGEFPEWVQDRVLHDSYDEAWETVYNA